MEWISVKDRLPQGDMAVLLRIDIPYRPLTGIYYSEDEYLPERGAWLRSYGEWVTHWMPIPWMPPSIAPLS